jgi:MerR family transcriptional regulator, copper efflux regulator
MSVGDARQGPFNIGEAAALSGVSAKMLRHYESLGLLPRVARTGAGYRQYGHDEVHTLRFIRRARDLGFGIPEIKLLVGLWQNRRRASANVKRIALEHVTDLERRIAEMQAMKRALEALARSCHGDERAECPILDDLAADVAPAPAAKRPASHRLRR